MKRVILISGCSRGLGRKLAETLAAQNFIVYAGMRKTEEIKESKSVWENSLPDLRPIKLDVGLDSDCQKAIKEIIAKEGHLDILINNAGYTLSGPTINFTSQEFLDIINTNTIGAFRLIREVVPQMQLKKNGRIINITSLNGLIALPNFGLYCSSKFALEALALSLRYELKQDGIWVTNLEPGAITREGVVKKLPHVPAREKFWIIKKLMPMVSEEEIVKKIKKIIEEPKPPAQVTIGRDAKILTFLAKLLPQKDWDSLLSFVWQR